MANKNSSKIKGLRANDNLQILHVDSLEINVRTDDYYFIRLLTGLPEAVVEQCRFMMDKDSVIETIDNLCKLAKYYPQKPGKSK